MATITGGEPETDVEVLAPHIVRSPGTRGGKPRIAGTRIWVGDVYLWHHEWGLSVDQILEDWSWLTRADVYAALAYYWDHQEEIERIVREEEAFVAQFIRDRPETVVVHPPIE